METNVLNALNELMEAYKNSTSLSANAVLRPQIKSLKKTFADLFPHKKLYFDWVNEEYCFCDKEVK